METKKFYEQPQAEVIEIELQQVLCNSGGDEEDWAPKMGDVEGLE